ncbi:hypothetical protein [Mycetohabitans endofungorum]|uniref:hypothetical protein n=1 Tax=Mycetohabitans endofungorum TaxID=417203 RepID=UPI002B05AF80|nr:hypothetical protein [Mycetohabitans endofungorum]
MLNSVVATVFCLTSHSYMALVWYFNNGLIVLFNGHIGGVSKKQVLFPDDVGYAAGPAGTQLA